MAQLEQLGHPAPAAGTLTLLVTGVPGTAQARLTSIGAELVEDPEATVHAEVVSTRLPPDELGAVQRRLGSTPHPVVILAHTGAERVAAELVAAGATGLIGEGNEEALLGLVDAERSPSVLVASFEARFGDGGGHGATGVEPETGLPDRRAFERRLGALADHEEIPRVATLRVVSDRWADPKADPVVTLQRRRLATALAHVAGAIGTELYRTGPAEFGLIGPDLSPNDCERLADRFVAVASTFSDRGLPLRLVIGHAGPESSSDLEELIDLARRAVDVAAVDGSRHVLGAEQLALGVSVTTELEATLKLVASVEAHQREGAGHGERVGRIAAELARAYGWSPAAVARIQLAGHVHDVGRAGLPREVIDGPYGLDGDLLEIWRTFPARGAEALRLSAGPLVASTVRSQCERWDGSGFPDGLRGAEIPDGARVLAVAHAVEELLLTDPSASIATLAEHLRARAGTELEPELVEEAVGILTLLLVAAERAAA